MAYEITEQTKTIYTVDYQDFNNRKSAEAYVLLRNTWDQMTSQGYRTLYDIMEQGTVRTLIAQLQEYVAAKDAIYAPVASVAPVSLFTETNFDKAKADTASAAVGRWVNNLDDMKDVAKDLWCEGMKAHAIQFVRSCFKETPGVKETKDWVEALVA